MRLVTAFQPFAQRSQNGSATVLVWLRRRWPAGFARSRLLPVLWDRAPTLLRLALVRQKPHVFLGLGEGKPDRVALETLAQNQMHGRDEAGVEMTEEPISRRGPEHRKMSLRVPQKLAAGLPVPFVISTDAGRFLCNRILWEALQFTPCRATFLHLPPQAEMPAAEYARIFGPFVLSVLQHLS